MPNKKDLNKENGEDLPLDDHRRVKTHSPGALTAKRFFRNRLAVVGLAILGFMFLFSFVGGWLIPYRQDQVFYREELQEKEFAGVRENDTFRFMAAPGQNFDAVLQAQFTLYQGKQDFFTYRDQTYELRQDGADFYSIFTQGERLAIAYKDIPELTSGEKPNFDFVFAALQAYTQNGKEFTVGEQKFSLTQTGDILQNGDLAGHISRLVIQPKVAGTTVSRGLRQQIEQAVATDQSRFSYTEDSGKTREFSLYFDAANDLWSVREATATRVWDAYAPPSRQHLLGTDKNGMDMLTRLMYGGRVSLVIGFIVVFISAFLGVVLGGTAGYFGKWVDNLIMRTVDVFYCIPSTPLLIILGAAMDGMRVDPQLRMLFLMLILGFLGWPGIARLVRGQILSLREQEFMTATEAAGLSVWRRIFRHLIPNVIPQLIVSCTMSLGSTILTEATLSFLGLGVKFPFASWGNIMNDVANAHVLTSYWFVWIPAGVALVLSVLGFNFVGDGLRDAFDPRMKR